MLLCASAQSAEIYPGSATAHAPPTVSSRCGQWHGEPEQARVGTQWLYFWKRSGCIL